MAARGIVFLLFIGLPPKLVEVHQALDKAVDKCYHGKAFNSEAERIEFLFELLGENVEKE